MRKLTIFIFVLLLGFFVVGVISDCLGDNEATIEAKKTMGIALESLQNKDQESFIKNVVKTQRQKLGLKTLVGMPSEVNFEDLTLVEALENFIMFSEFKAFELLDTATIISDVEIRIGVNFTLDDGYFAIFWFYMIKENEVWLIDMKASIEGEYKRKLSNAFELTKFTH